jgi:hypothetical protein
LKQKEKRPTLGPRLGFANGVWRSKLDSNSQDGNKSTKPELT